MARMSLLTKIELLQAQKLKNNKLRRRMKERVAIAAAREHVRTCVSCQLARAMAGQSLTDLLRSLVPKDEQVVPDVTSQSLH
jgi:predicted metal-dependent hydrolase